MRLFTRTELKMLKFRLMIQEGLTSQEANTHLANLVSGAEKSHKSHMEAKAKEAKQTIKTKKLALSTQLKASASGWEIYKDVKSK